ncbi:DUF2530 domain-containing protein [Agromyces badenianii]|uniref:DUF2530 domain-containing protein n=1 Tax=Agromyces badenianii TaxID=2080742 RepID=A0A2S0WTW9_9MICO|nr:DUF2530 domain-containing protein [Agromyces badenianii]AWB94783.1 DUF2530 domain-containing protein [Agromyces badenianii]PWC03420.1 DUF2530 domain-containing protein [Agromyces badenianii]
MRLWLSEEERRPDPAPARADARKAVLAGTLAWVVALVACFVSREPLESAGLWWFAAAAVTGIAFGLVGLAVVQVIRRRARQAPARPID